MGASKHRNDTIATIYLILSYYTYDVSVSNMLTVRLLQLSNMQRWRRTQRHDVQLTYQRNQQQPLSIPTTSIPQVSTSTDASNVFDNVVHAS
ncbi:hypothetical protein L195_g004355 [Trifolium pratense]|uniref:Uncharacterized protein n=1 Tax=Trifolium pratense TaxID=57577 RepID=A0A2K3NXV2_TRIPR|nr:hypothetical protein L195_g004355 [Trifolium pratense]